MEFLAAFNHHLFHLVNSGLSNSFFDFIFLAITDLHKTVLFRYVFVPGILLVLIYTHGRKGIVEFLGLLLSIGIVGELNALLKNHFKAPRPSELKIEIIERVTATGYSFPSNHAVNMFCLAFFLSSLFPRLRWIFWCVAGLIAFSRVYNGAHLPGDVLFGALIGACFGILGAKLTSITISRLERR